jgi:hypothetical protein
MPTRRRDDERSTATRIVTRPVVRLSELIARSSQAALGRQRADGSFPPGVNGPYADPETPVRNTAHWLLTLLCAHRLTGDERFRDAAARAAAYLTASGARPHGATFFCRTNPRKDASNGLIGQAWVIEALAAAAVELGEARCREVASEVFWFHPFDQTLGLWRRMHVDGRRGTLDLNFNHQLWFAAAGALLEDEPDGPIRRRVGGFLDGAASAHFRVAASGRILHRIGGLGDGPAAPLDASEQAAMIRKEIGYQAFNLYAFALLAPLTGAHPLWADPRLAAALAFVGTEEYLQGLEDNPYAYAYNPVGFEVAFALQVLGDRPSRGPGSGSLASWWVARQLERCWDRHSLSMTRSTEDPATSAARLYEATRLDDVEVSLAG